MPEDAKQTLPAFFLALGGLLIAAVVTVVLYSIGMTDGKDLTAVAGLFTAITGTLVGAFLGVHIGAAGKMKLQGERDSLVMEKERAKAMLSEEDRQKIEKMEEDRGS
ncbi:hypothetical protein EEB14_20740 [Rhodococcus sp. WS4]|nr:hypothetical protein EEB14_20740 [Rhodococcus sp. WS4]